MSSFEDIFQIILFRFKVFFTYYTVHVLVDASEHKLK